MAVVCEGFKPAKGAIYSSLWTRDNAYAIWHDPARFTSAEIRQFVTYFLSKRSTSSVDPDDGPGYGTAFADFIPDRINATGQRAFQNPGASYRPFMDGIAFVVLALWTDFDATGHTATFTTNKAAIDACLAAIPRSGSGCVYSDPANPSVDYGFTDAITKTGDVAYGTALLAWAYKMLAEINGESGSGQYTTLLTAAKAGLATLRQGDGWYAGSSGNQAAVDDVWATALIVAEELVSGADRTASANTIKAAYLAGNITSRGWVRHMPAGQFWVGAGTSPQYQNGGYWLTPIWDCYRAVDLVDGTTADAWRDEAMAEVYRQIYVEPAVGPLTAPLEWFHEDVISAARGYTATAALVRRFA